eukprot:4506411-Pyramimonas_sp.AAC.1
MKRRSGTKKLIRSVRRRTRGGVPVKLRLKLPPEDTKPQKAFIRFWHVYLPKRDRGTSRVAGYSVVEGTSTEVGPLLMIIAVHLPGIDGKTPAVCGHACNVVTKLPRQEGVGLTACSG